MQMRKVLQSVETSVRFEIPRKNNRHKTGFFRKRNLSGQPSNVCRYSWGEGRDTFFSCPQSSEFLSQLGLKC